jgi:hypothetical protein
MTMPWIIRENVMKTQLRTTEFSLWNIDFQLIAYKPKKEVRKRKK